MNLSPELITAIAALLGAIFAIYKSLRGTKREDASQDAATAKYYADIAKTYGETVKGSLDRIDELEEEQKKMRVIQQQISDELASTRNELKRRDVYIAYLLNGISILLKQFADHNIDPCWSPETIEKQVP